MNTQHKYRIGIDFAKATQHNTEDKSWEPGGSKYFDDVERVDCSEQHNTEIEEVKEKLQMYLQELESTPMTQIKMDRLYWEKFTELTTTLLQSNTKKMEDKYWSAHKLLWDRMQKWNKEWQAENPKERELTFCDALTLIEWKLEQNTKAVEGRIAGKVHQMMIPEINEDTQDEWKKKLQYNQALQNVIKTLTNHHDTTE